MSAEWLFIRDLSKIDFGEESTLLARAWHEGNRLPGYVSSNGRVGYFTHEGQVLEKQSEFEIFKGGSHIVWRLHRRGQYLHSKAFQVGKTVQNEPLFVGRVRINGTYIYGQVRENAVCYIFVNQEIRELQTFDLLLSN